MVKIRCQKNQIDGLDAGNLKDLNELECFNNQLTSLVVNSEYLTEPNCCNKRLTSLDVSSLTDVPEVLHLL